MAHELEIAEDGEVSFVYNLENGTPWHGLGIAVEGHQTMAEMLKLAKADYKVELRPVYVQQDDGLYVEIEDRFATTRQDTDGTIQAFEVMKSRYAVVQNETVLAKALQVVGASQGDAVLETVGVLLDGRQFFATIDLGALVIDPQGISDEIARYLLVQTSHDGSMPITYANTDIRAVCANTCRFGIAKAKSTFKARHTPNVESTLDEAKTVLRLSSEWAEEFARLAETMLSIPVPQGSPHVATVLDALWPEADADTDRKVENRNLVVADIRNRFGNDRNAGAVGWNGWGLYNAFTEHLDHGRTGSGIKRAMASMDSTSLVSAKKALAADRILALAN